MRRMYSLIIFPVIFQSCFLNVFSLMSSSSRSCASFQCRHSSTSLWALKGRPSGFHRNIKKNRISTDSKDNTRNGLQNMDTNSHLQHVAQSAANRIEEIISQLQRNGYAIVDEFLGSDISVVYRREAELMLSKMVPSQSTRWDETSNSVIAYDKHNVLSTQLLGGEMYYSAPRLHEYIVSMVQNIVPLLSKTFPEAKLSPTLASNKLAVCLGDGSYYDKHFDNSGSDDFRKLTVLYYLNPSWTPDLGGYFRAFHPNKREDEVNINKENVMTSEYEDIAPIADRLLIFWSDRLEHSVLPSTAPKGPVDHRYAMTIWIATTDSASIHI